MFNLDMGGTLQLESAAFPGKSLCILGIAGSGKSNSGKYLITQLVTAIPFTIVDVDDEYGWLKHQHQVLVVGNTANSDMNVLPSQADRLAKFAVENGLSVLLDMSNRKQAEIEAFIHGYANGLWECRFQRQPHILLLEEAQDILPQGCDIEEDTLTGKLIQIAKRGRKFNLSLWLISQRPQDVDKRALTQTRIRILHRVTHPLDIKAEQALLPLSLRGADAESEHPPLNKLKIGQGYVVIDEEPSLCCLPLVESAEGGAVVDTVMVRRQMDSALLDQLKQVFDTPVEDGDPVALQATIDQQRREIAALNECIEGLRVQLVAQPAPEQPPLSAPRLDEQPALVEITHPSQEYITEEALKRRRNRDYERFAKILPILQRLGRAQKDAVALLLDNEGEEFTIDEIAQRIRVMSKTINGKLPTMLLDKEILRFKESRAYIYVGNFRKAFRDQYPYLDVQMLIEKVERELA